jgi:hypothetical protein
MAWGVSWPPWASIGGMVCVPWDAAMLVPLGVRAVGESTGIVVASLRAQCSSYVISNLRRMVVLPNLNGSCHDADVNTIWHRQRAPCASGAAQHAPLGSAGLCR